MDTIACQKSFSIKINPAGPTVDCTGFKTDANNLIVTAGGFNPDPTHVSMIVTPGVSSGTFSITEFAAPPVPQPVVGEMSSEAFCVPGPGSLTLAGVLNFSVQDTAFPPPASSAFNFDIGLSVLRVSDDGVVASVSQHVNSFELPASNSLPLNAVLPPILSGYYISFGGLFLNGDVTADWSVSSS